MAYGDRINPVTDDFSTDPFAARWTNGYGDWATLTWAGTDYVVGAGGDAGCRRDNEGAYPNNQYSKGTCQNTDTSGWRGVAVRMQNSTTDESCYVYYAAEGTGTSTGIWEVTSAFGFTELASGSTAAPTIGEIYVCEVEGTTIRGGSNQSGSDIQELSTTDATIASGRPGIAVFDTGAQVDAWEGGEIGVAAGAGVAFRVSLLRVGR